MDNYEKFISLKEELLKTIQVSSIPVNIQHEIKGKLLELAILCPKEFPTFYKEFVKSNKLLVAKSTHFTAQLLSDLPIFIISEILLDDELCLFLFTECRYAPNKNLAQLINSSNLIMINRSRYIVEQMHSSLAPKKFSSIMNGVFKEVHPNDKNYRLVYDWLLSCEYTRYKSELILLYLNVFLTAKDTRYDIPSLTREEIPLILDNCFKCFIKDLDNDLYRLSYLLLVALRFDEEVFLDYLLKSLNLFVKTEPYYLPVKALLFRVNRSFSEEEVISLIGKSDEFLNILFGEFKVIPISLIKIMLAHNLFELTEKVLKFVKKSKKVDFDDVIDELRKDSITHENYSFFVNYIFQIDSEFIRSKLLLELIDYL